MFSLKKILHGVAQPASCRLSPGLETTGTMPKTRITTFPPRFTSPAPGYRTPGNEVVAKPWLSRHKAGRSPVDRSSLTHDDAVDQTSALVDARGHRHSFAYLYKGPAGNYFSGIRTGDCRTLFLLALLVVWISWSSLVASHRLGRSLALPIRQARQEPRPPDKTSSALASRSR